MRVIILTFLIFSLNYSFAQGGWCTSTSISVGNCGSGTTSIANSSSQFDSSCPGDESSEGFFWLEDISQGSEYEFVVTSLNGSDIAISVFGVDGGSCNSNITEISCSDDLTNGIEQLTATLSGNDYYYLQIYTVDGSSGASYLACYDESSSSGGGGTGGGSGTLPTVQDCDGAIAVCQDTYSESTAFSGQGNFPDEIDGNVSCLESGEKNSVWYIFTTQSAGNICFDITPNDINDDYDWAVYNITNSPCSEIATNPAMEVSCNFSGASGITGANGSGDINDEPCIPVTANQTYVINVSQFSTSTNGYEIDFSNSTANMWDSSPPEFSGVTSPPTGASSLEFYFSENVDCSTIDDTDFTLSGPGGPYTLSNVTGSICSLGGAYEDVYSADVSPPLTLDGTYDICLVSGSGIINDICGNQAVPACYNFVIANNPICPTIDPISDLTVCESFTFPAILGSDLTGSEAYYTGVGGTGTQYNIGDAYTNEGSITLYAYDGTTGCDDQESFILTLVSTAFTSSSNPTSCGSNNVDITVSISSGSSLLDITIDNGVDPSQSNSTGLFPNVTSGTYNITVSDPINDLTNTCQSNSSTIFSGSNPLVIDQITPTATSCGADNGSISITLSSSGTGTITYTVDDGVNPAIQNTTGTLTNLPTGTYAVTVEDVAGCQLTENINVASSPLFAVDGSISKIDDYCGNGNGEIGIPISGGVADYTFQIDNGVDPLQTHTTSSTSHTFTGLNVGTYDVTIEDINGCLLNETVILDDKLISIANVPLLQTTCGEDNGEISVAVTGGQFPFEIAVNGPGTFDPSNPIGPFTDLSPGTYAVTVTDANGCEDVSVEQILSSVAPSINSLNITSTSCGDPNGELEVVVSSGTPSYSITIDNGVDPPENNTTGLFTSLNPGTYSVLVEDAALCQVNSNAVITTSDVFAISASKVDATCGDPNGQIGVSVLSGGTSPITYTIDNGVISKSNTTGGFDLLYSGVYSVTAENADGCLATESITLSDNVVLIDLVTPTPTSCGDQNGEILIQASGGTTPYIFSVDNGVNTPPSSNSIGEFTSLPNGTYSCIVTDGIGCQQTSSVDVLPSSAPNFNLINPQATTCGDPNGLLEVGVTSGSPGYTISIDNGIDAPPSANSTGLFSDLPPGTYSIIVEDALGCTNSGNTIIDSSEPLVIDVATDSASCGNANGQISISVINGGTAPYSYTISENGNSQSNFTGNFVLVPSADYTISVEDAKNCVSSVSATVHDTTLSWESVLVENITCFADIDGQIIISLPSGSGEANFSINNGFTTQPSGEFNNLQPGTYNIMVENTYGCTVDSTVIVNSPEEFGYIPHFTADTIVCIGGTVSSLMEITGGTGAITYNWSQGVSVGNPSNYQPISNGVISVYGVDENGCVSQITSQSISLYSPLNVTVSSADEKICEGDSTFISAVASGGIGAPYIYNWNNGIPDTSSYYVKPTDTTDYILNLSDGCESPAALASVVVNVNTLQDVDFISSAREGCIPFTVDFAELLEAYNGSCTWDFGDLNSSTNCQNVSHLYNSVGCYDVSLTVVDSNNCTKEVKKIEEICAYETPVADFVNDRDVLSLLEPELSLINESMSADQYIWSIGDGVSTVTYNSEDLDFTFKNYEPGDYTVCLEALTNPGCTDTLCRAIKLTDNYLFYMPSSFTPDSDGINDEFGPVMNGVADNYVFNVYNRWGEVVFTSTEDIPMWTGDYNNNGVLCPMGVYVWKIELLDQVNDIYKEYIGNVTMVR